ncbi:MAG: saccharopine dehydrogenase NADP-binding domain-containing protein [Saprospiraceae bacterium]|nr:saccharopine dehydrogenase NADP-binding domain-containing protein [Saprospiraceae bacterium]
MLLLYGAYGYTGQLICDYAKETGTKLILAGRSIEKLKTLPYSKEWEVRPFGLDDPAIIDQNLKEVSVLLHAAGPFIHTAKPMMEACIRNGIHYLDITGEIGVFEMAHALDKKAQAAGIVLLPGVGFDVVPTDCLALHLKNLLPDATHLQLAFSASGGGVSRGTAITMAQSLGEDGAMRKDGKIIRVPVGYRTLMAPFHGKPRFCMTIPWGDVSTAYYTTGIPTIETYMGVPPKSYKWVKLQRFFGWFLRMSWVRKMAENRIRKGAAGPSEKRRENGKSLVWGKVSNAKGESREARLLAPNGYTLTAITAIMIANRVKNVNPGFQTPAAAFGPDFILEVAGTEREDI